ncbi:flavodoxin family protein [Clostridium estertheticum]|uniref:Flavodoxin family protein n=1 Tax=Clostridium estertheticum TaxID=238834 RepID=A0A7Y3WQT9_9CLOT|nr:flavodoxin family protein [Clostridium estertheticum]NNU75252.1 flavodoxin family protein [Clostridium estertheticum]WBL48278.1 flavodoxin family protein [Clostridium estertheticum]
MKVIGINGSARKNGNTAILIQTVFNELENQDIETELIQLFDKEIKSCKGCFACKGIRECIIRDDAFNECFHKMLEADGIILGSPVYSADITSKMKAFVERSGVIISTNPKLLKYKVCASVVALRRGGGMTAVDTLNHFLLNKEVLLIGSTYWNMVYGKEVGDVLNDKEGMENMKNLGQNMAWVLNKIY